VRSLAPWNLIRDSDCFVLDLTSKIDVQVPVQEYYLMKKPIITIAGSLGSGKSSTAKAVASALGFRHYSSGDLFRQLAVERGESIEAMNISAEVQRDIDLKVDSLLQQMYRTHERLVIDSRMAWHWMPLSFKVFLVIDPDTAAERIFNHLQEEGRTSEDATSVQEVRKSIGRRFASEQKRYAALYGVDATDPLNFDVVINTKYNDLRTVTALVGASYHAWRVD
jgi:cytidylate kinase